MRIVFLFLVLAFTLKLAAQKNLKELDSSFEEALKLWNIPGMSIGIIKDGKVVLAKGYGVLKSGESTKTDSQTMYAIASNTKAFTTTALATLVEQNKVGWDAPIRNYLPNLRLYDTYTSENATVRDLLTHKMGYGDYGGDVIWYKSLRSAEELLPLIQFVPKRFNFRDGFGYSNLMYITAGEVIRAATNQTWDAYIKETFLDPLGMNRTVASVKRLSSYTNVATPHKPNAEANLPIDWANWDNMSSAGAIISSVDDMLKWVSLHLSNGTYKGKEYFSQDIQEELWHPNNNYRVTHNTRARYPRNFSAYGLGFSLYDHEGYKVITHGGAYDGMYSRVAMVPDQNLGIVILTNSMKGIANSLTYEILDYYLEGGTTDWNHIAIKGYTDNVNRMNKRKDAIRQKKQLGTSPISKKNEVIGLYIDKMYGEDIHIGINKNKALSLHFDKAPELEAVLEHWHHNTYEIKWKETHAWFDFGTLSFTIDNNSEVQGITFDVPNGDIFFDEIKAVKVIE